MNDPALFGIERTFVANVNGETRTATDPQTLATKVEGGKRLDPAALHGYLCLSHVPSPLGIYRNVNVVPAPLWQWNPEAVRSEWDEADAAQSLRTLLQEAVARRWSGGETVGVYLSGGLDSSLVAALLVEAGANVVAFTLDFGPPFNLEVPHAQAVAAHLSLPLHTVSADNKAVGRAMDATNAALSQPFGDGVTVPLYLLGRAAKEFVSVVWNGEGGDQLFGGWANKPMVAAALYGSGNGNGDRASEDMAAYLQTYHRFIGLTNRLYTARARAETAGLNPADWVRGAIQPPGWEGLPFLHRLRAANLALKGAQNIATRMVDLAQVHGLWVVAPFFDRALADWTFTLPPALLLNGACEKYLLKRVAEAYLPASVVWREKRGMGVPTAEWVLDDGSLRRETLHRLDRKRILPAGWFEPDFVRSLLRGEDPTAAGFRRRRVGEKIWALLMLQGWLAAHKMDIG